MSLFDREGIENYERRDFWENVEVEREEIISALKTVVRCWTENEIDRGFEPTLDNFRDYYPEWNSESLFEIIATQIGRVIKDDEERKTFGIPFNW